MKYLYFLPGYFFLFLFLSVVSLAQNPRFDSYKILDNRKNVDVNTIHQGKKGFIWLGTEYGLVRFDGKEFQQYTTEDSLYENKISSVYQDEKGRMWIGHPSGKISFYTGKIFKKFSPEEGLPKEEISTFFTDKDSILWFTTYGEGVYYYKGENKKRLYNLNSDDGLLDDYVYTMVQDKDKNLYFGTDHGISIYDIKNDTFPKKITMSDGLPDNIVKHLHIKGNLLWIAMEDGGICNYNLNTGEFFTFPNWEFGSVNDFTYLSDRELWVSTKRNGIIKCQLIDSTVRYSMFGENLGLSNKRTHTVFHDREKNIWMGTKTGVSIRKNNHFEFLSEKDGFDIKHIFSFTMDDEGNYWVASQGGLYKISINRMGMMKQKRLFQNSEFKNTSFISLHKGPEGFIWAGTYGYGVFKIHPHKLTFQNFTSKQGMSDNNVISINGKNGNLWFSTLGGGVTKYSTDANTFIQYTKEDGLTSSYVYSVFIDSDNKKWISTDGGGVMYIENDSLHTFCDSVFSSGNKVIYDIAEDSKGNLWFNCPEQGLLKYNGKEFFKFDVNNGLKTNTIQSIVPDAYGNLLIISNQGIDKLNIEDNTFKYHGKDEGVAYWEPNLNSAYADSLGNIWVGTKDGLIKYNANAAGETKILPKIFLTDKIVNFEKVESTKNTFSYNENHITFDYIALWYQAAGNLTYRYKLTGYDMDWSPETSVRMTTYPNLPPGEYTFIVQVMYAGGKWIDSPNSRYTFTIKPPFWQTTWFIISVIVAVLAGIYIFIRLRLRKLERDKHRLEAEVKKRTAEIQKQKEEIETQRDEIEAQRDNVVKQRNQIEKQNDEIKASIQYASRIQNAVLPPKQSFDSQIEEHFILFKPKDIVSGDFYYLNTKQDKIIIAAADCTGHGVPGAFMSMLGTSLLNHILSQLNDDFDAGEILTELRAEVKSALRQSEEDVKRSKDGMDISLCVMKKGSNKIHYSGAYNPLIIVRNKEIMRYKGDPMPIGIHIREKERFTDHELEIQKGDMVYMYSDGYQDQFGGPDKRKFLPKNLREKLVEVSDRSMEEQRKELDRTFEQWKGEKSQIDDVLVMGFRV